MRTDAPTPSVFAVLIVEDEPIILLDALEMVSDAGFVVFGARSAAQAIELLEEHPQIRILFTDYNLLGSTTGLNLAHAARDRWPPIAIMMTSGKATLSAADLPQDAQFFRKPYCQKAVVEAMHDTFARFAV